MSWYIPQKDAQLRLWAVNFDTLLTAGPGVYGLSAPDAAFVHGYVATFTAALQTASDPSTRTPASVAAKDGAKAAMIDILRVYSQQIRLNLGIADSDKVALGLTIADLTPTPVPAPTTTPILAVLAAQPLVQTLRFADSASPDSRAKPEGAIGMQLFVWVGDDAPPDPADWRFALFVTRQPLAVRFSTADVGKRATYRGRWQTRTGLVGDWSGETGMVVVG